MQKELFEVPVLYCNTDKATLRCAVADDATGLELVVVDSTNSFYKSTFDVASSLKKIKGDDKDWKAFYDGIIEGCNGNSAKIVCNGNAEVTIGSASFTVAKDAAVKDGIYQMAQLLFDSINLRTDSKAATKFTENLQKQEADLIRQVTSLEQEKRSLADMVSFQEADEKANMEEYSTLQAQLSEITERWKVFCAENGKDPDAEDPDAPLEPDFSKPVGRRGAEMECRKYDDELLRLAKSQFTPADSEGVATKALEGNDDNWLRVIRPYTKSQYDEHMKALPEGGRQNCMAVISKMDQWDYDVWVLQDLADKGSLFYTAYSVFCYWDFFRRFKIDEQVAINFFSQVEAGYHACPYHNSMHGADVCHVAQYILKKGGLREKAELTDEDCFATVVAGMIHDYDHPGLNNNFHVKIQSYLATLYNDRAILENHHLAEIFDLCKDPRFDIFHGFSDEQRRDVRETMIEMVTGTDMGLHAKIFGAWKRRIKQDHDLHKKKETQRQALVMAIKMADISNCGRPTFLYLRWGMKLIEEFFMQGDNERHRGDPVSPFMDRAAPSMSKSQIAFMNFVVVPMYESIAEYLPDMHFSVDHAEENKQYWNDNDDSV